MVKLHWLKLIGKLNCMKDKMMNKIKINKILLEDISKQLKRWIFKNF
jgi:hypothetical protein